MLFWAVVRDSTEEAVELFTSREEAEAIVQAWDRDEPDQVGSLRVERIEFEVSPNQSAHGCLRSGSALNPALAPRAGVIRLHPCVELVAERGDAGLQVF
jgi:hypothetical protein